MTPTDLTKNDLSNVPMKISRRLTLALLLPLNATAFPTASAPSTSVDTTACHAVPLRLATAAARIVGSNWPRYRPFMCLYPVHAPSGEVPLYLLALDVTRADHANALAWRNGTPIGPDHVGGDIDPIPLPAIIDNDGHFLGSLPRAFPHDPPASMAVAFSDWLGSFPYRISLRIDDPTQDTTAKPPYCPPPFMWNKAAARFVERAGNFYVSCPQR